jgi:uncharacterized membrane protein YfcA
VTFGLWLLGAACAFLIGAAKTGVTGAGTLIIPFMVFLVGDARHAAAWTAPLLSTGDVFAVIYWRRHADAKKLFSLIPWVAVGMVGGAFALSSARQCSMGWRPASPPRSPTSPGPS